MKAPLRWNRERRGAFLFSPAISHQVGGCFSVLFPRTAQHLMNGLPDDVRQFVTENISSVAKLEVLLLLRAEKDKDWTAGAVAKELATSADVMETHLQELLARDLLTVSDSAARSYRYNPKTPELDRIVRDLADIYQTRRVSVITLIYSEPVDKVRTFADAFRLRKEK